MAQQNAKNKTNNNNKKNNTKKEVNKKINASEKEFSKIKDNKDEKKTKENQEIKVEQIFVEETKKENNTHEKKSFKLNSKQRDFILVLLVSVLLVMALVLTGNKEPKFDIELPVALEGQAGFNEITYAEYEEKLNTEAPFVVVIVNDGCGYCELYEPVVTEVANEYGLPISYINLAHLTSDERVALSKSNSYLRKQKWGTPTTLFMYGEHVVDSIGGYTEKEELVEFVKENFVIGE